MEGVQVVEFPLVEQPLLLLLGGGEEEIVLQWEVVKVVVVGEVEEKMVEGEVNYLMLTLLTFDRSWSSSWCKVNYSCV